MAPLTYKRRRRTGPLSEDKRAEAIKRVADEFSVRQKMEKARQVQNSRKARDPVAQARPEPQQVKAEHLRQRANREREVPSHGGAVAAPRRGGSKPMHMTTRGPRRLSFRQAYSRRTTDTSRARVLALYGRSKPPTPRPGDSGGRTIHKPVSPEQQAAMQRARVQKTRPPHLRRRRGRAVARV
jgi:hypothetical protein